MADGRIAGRDEGAERARLKRLLGRAAALGARARGVSRSGRQADRQAAAYLANLARQVARLLAVVPRHDVPQLPLPQGAGDTRGLSHHVLRHTLTEQPAGLFVRLLVLGGDGRLRLCAIDTASPATRLWSDYDLGAPPPEFEFHDTVTALGELLDRLEAALRAEEQRVAERVGRLEALTAPRRGPGGLLSSAAGSARPMVPSLARPVPDASPLAAPGAAVPPRPAIAPPDVRTAMEPPALIPGLPTAAPARPPTVDAPPAPPAPPAAGAAAPRDEEAGPPRPARFTRLSRAI